MLRRALHNGEATIEGIRFNFSIICKRPRDKESLLSSTDQPHCKRRCTGITLKVPEYTDPIDRFLCAEGLPLTLLRYLPLTEWVMLERVNRSWRRAVHYVSWTQDSIPISLEQTLEAYRSAAERSVQSTYIIVLISEVMQRLYSFFY